MRIASPPGSVTAPPWQREQRRKVFGCSSFSFHRTDSQLSVLVHSTHQPTAQAIVGGVVSEAAGASSSRSSKKMPTTAGGGTPFFPRRWILFAYLVLGVNAAVYLRPAARPLLNLVDQNGLENEIEQVRVSLAAANHMRVSWISSSSNSPSSVQYGTSPGKYESSATGSKLNYGFLLYKSGTIHGAVLGPLENNTVYYYKCGGMGKEFSFKTPPANLPVTFAVVGDIGQTGWTVTTLEHVQKSTYDVLLFAGDLSYADYYQPRWDSFGRLVEPSASSRPWMVTEGNHEIERIPLISSFRAYNTRWRMPYEESGSDSNLYYSFDVAGAHVLMLGSYADFGQRSPQYKWLQADLARIDRKRTPWLIAVLHAPWYNSNEAHRNEGDDMMKAIESLLQAAGTDLLFAGHVHAYERWDRMFQGKKDDCGIVHITIGDGGNREGLATKFLDPKPENSLFREASFGHGQFKLVNSTHAHWSWHRNDDDQAKIADELWIQSLSSTGCSLASKKMR
ncbi:purple acid phosphatase 18 [Selaginella moellendorffii]|uniref:purple acid phosphatase 18 n=1 Tax=Selaginella moellendorffii TaxID=88036 RepID=UPI000D1C6277|nr:purple acid phosphatase 18 [Selaginella moellendorffii]|eukprot:XP_024515666.1 purple acid phosphatase 18 [Selaginella moellendorffii]